MKDVTPQTQTLSTNWLDKAVCFVSPERGARRLAGRMALVGMFSTYQGAATSRTTGNNWLASRLSTNSALEAGLIRPWKQIWRHSETGRERCTATKGS